MLNCTYITDQNIYRCEDDDWIEKDTNDGAVRCAFDNGYQLPEEPSYNAVTKTCENVVLNVTYNFTWSADKIIKLDAYVLLGNVSMEYIEEYSKNVTFTNESGGIETIEKTWNVSTYYRLNQVFFHAQNFLSPNFS